VLFRVKLHHANAHSQPNAPIGYARQVFGTASVGSSKLFSVYLYCGLVLEKLSLYQFSSTTQLAGYTLFLLVYTLLLYKRSNHANPYLSRSLPSPDDPPNTLNMSSPLRHPATFSSASSAQPGSSLQNPLRSIGVRAHPKAEHFYVLDRAQGFFQVIAREAQDYRELGYPVFDGYGNRVTQFDAAHQAATRRNAGADQADAFYDQLDHVWEIIEMGQAMAEAAADETIHYSKQKLPIYISPPEFSANF
jgi:hypothetical protein